MLEFIYDQNTGLGEWFQEKTNILYHEKMYTCLGVKNDNKIIAAVVYCQWGDGIMLMHVYTEGWGWSKKEYIQNFFRYPFKQLNIFKCMFPIIKKNIKCINFVKKLGAVQESEIKHENDNETILFFTLTENQFKFKD
jgi:hypothetical protein